MNTDSTDIEDAPKTSEDILSQRIDSALSELERSTDGLFLSALSAGLDLGFGPLLVVAVLTLVGGVYGENETSSDPFVVPDS